MITLLTWNEVREQFPSTPTSRSGRRLWIRRRGFPKPRYLSPNRPVWDAGEIQAWYSTRPRYHIDAVGERVGNDHE